MCTACTRTAQQMMPLMNSMQAIVSQSDFFDSRSVNLNYIKELDSNASSLTIDAAVRLPIQAAIIIDYFNEKRM